MIDVAALNEVLEDSLEDATSVTVTVSACQFRCCGGGWQHRHYTWTEDGTHVIVEPQEYIGRVLSISVDEFLIQCDGELGKLSEVVARFDDLLDAKPVVD